MGWLGRTYVEVTAGLRDVGVVPASDLSATERDPETDYRSVVSRTRSTYRSSLDDLVMLRTDAMRGGRCDAGDMPLQLKIYREELIAAGVNPAIAQRWIDATISFASSMGDTTERGTPWLEHLQRTVGRELRIGRPIQTHPGDRRIVALVGPTGVGKTTTVAKLAAGFRLESRRRVGLLTIDTFRIAAVQQLRAYAEIMDLPMEVVERPEQMKPALDRLADTDLVLIDTAGRSPRSDARIDQLVELLRCAQPDETHLVLSCTSSAASIQAAIQGFSPVRPTAAILTKLDETPQTAVVISAVVANDDFQGMPLSYTTNGQQVPDDIASAETESLLSRLLPLRLAISQLDAA
jgi:flagellar biosynthesis protein FlhF